MVLSTAVRDSQFTEAFKKRVEDEPNGELVRLRREAFEAFEAMGLPTQRLEDWKYTNVAPIGAVDWKIDSGRANTPAAPDPSLLSRFQFDRNGFTALNLAFADVAVLRIERETSVDEPIRLDFAAEAGTAIFPHVLIIAEEGSKATIVETYSSTSQSFTNAAVQVVIKDKDPNQPDAPPQEFREASSDRNLVYKDRYFETRGSLSPGMIGVTADISEGGCALLWPEPLPLGQTVPVRVHFGARTADWQALIVSSQGRAAKGWHRYGVRFQALAVADVDLINDSVFSLVVPDLFQTLAPASWFSLRAQRAVRWITGRSKARAQRHVVPVPVIVK